MSQEPDISYIVGDDAEGFNRFVTELRTLAAEQPRCKDLMADHPELSSTRNHHPVLPKVRVIREEYRLYIKPAERLFRIKLEVVDAVNKTSWITLLMRGDNLDVIGFINQNGVCYELGNPGSQQLPPPLGYESKCLGWVDADEAEEVGPAKLRKDFAKAAVQCLSGFADVGPPNNAKRSLFGLKIMICDSARMEPVREAIAAGWNKGGTAFTKQLQNCTRMWPVVSRALLDWMDRGYEGWTTLESMGITSSEAARKTVPLVFNDYDRICAY
jgi:hypothetical protein